MAWRSWWFPCSISHLLLLIFWVDLVVDLLDVERWQRWTSPATSNNGAPRKIIYTIISGLLILLAREEREGGCRRDARLIAAIVST